MRDERLTAEDVGPEMWAAVLDSIRTAERLLHRLGFPDSEIVQAVIKLYAPQYILQSGVASHEPVARAIAVVLAHDIDRALPGQGLSPQELFAFRRAIFCVALRLVSLVEPDDAEMDELARSGQGVGMVLVRSVLRTAPAPVARRGRRRVS
jgi:hypothetical protein